MKKEKFLWIIMGVVVVTAVILKLSSKEDDWRCENGAWIRHGNPRIAAPTSPCGQIEKVVSEFIPASTEIVSDDNVVASSEIIITQPQPDQLVSSPLNISGFAKGTWFFEANIPVKLLDAQSQVITALGGQAQGDWMTENMVPFQATLNFMTTATSGYLVVSRDNPSGLPENEESFQIPVKFKQ